MGRALKQLVSYAPASKLRRIREIDPKTKTLLVNVVNRHRESSLQTEIFSQTGRFADKGIAFEVNGPDPKSESSAVEQKVKTDRKGFATAGSDRIDYRFPPHSFTLLKIGLRD